jgi:hypothetical protein
MGVHRLIPNYSSIAYFTTQPVGWDTFNSMKIGIDIECLDSLFDLENPALSDIWSYYLGSKFLNMVYSEMGETNPPLDALLTCHAEPAPKWRSRLCRQKDPESVSCDQAKTVYQIYVYYLGEDQRHIQLAVDADLLGKWIQSGSPSYKDVAVYYGQLLLKAARAGYPITRSEMWSTTYEDR